MSRASAAFAVVAVILAIVLVWTSCGVTDLGDGALPRAGTARETSRAAEFRDDAASAPESRHRADAPDDDRAAVLESDRIPDGTAERTPLWGSGETVVSVSNAADGRPVEGALVRAAVRWPQYADPGDEPLSRDATTGADGVARLPKCRADTVWMVRKPGFRAFRADFEHPPAEVIAALGAAPPFPGVVLDARTGEPVPGVRIRADWIDAPWIDGPWIEADVERITDAAGRFELCGVPEGVYVEIAAAKDGLATVVVQASGVAAGAAPFVIRMGGGADVTGTVRDAAGAAVVGADVCVVPDGAPDPFREARWESGKHTFRRSVVRSGDGGRFAIRGVDVPSVVRVRVRTKDGEEGSSDALRIAAAGSHTDCDVVVGGLARLEVAFVDAATKRPVPCNRVKCSLDAEWTEARDDQKASADEAGELEVFERVLAGRHTIHGAPFTHLEGPPFVVEVKAGERRRVEIPVERGRVVTGRTVDAAGKPVSVYVSFAATWRGIEHYPNTRSGDDGRFELVGVPPTPGDFAAWQDEIGRVEREAVEIDGDLGDVVVGEEDARPSVFGRLAGCDAGTRVDLGVMAGNLGHSQTIRLPRDGTFRVDHIPAGVSSDVYVRPEGRAAFVLRGVVLRRGESRDVGEIAPPVGVVVAGRVVDADGKPVAGATVRVAEWWCASRMHTSPAGAFELADVAPGRTTLWIEPSPDVVWLHVVDARPDLGPVEVKLPRPGRLRCRVIDAAAGDAPLANVSVNVLRYDAEGVPVRLTRVIARTGPTGVLDLALFPDDYAVDLHPNLHRATDGPRRFTIVPGETVDVTIHAR